MIARRVSPATAEVEFLAKEVGGGEAYYRVTVYTAPFFKGQHHRRAYDIRAFTDDLAAQEGLRRFSEEVDPVV